ncbi:MAG: sugar transferase [Actinobacteria bacterium]|nr:sugar transferase [Actinomycetota bacterium]
MAADRRAGGCRAVTTTPVLAGPDRPAARPARAGRAGLAAKRACDILGALAGLAVLGLPMLALAACMRWQLGCPALFRQARVTGPGRQAVVLKLRTLRPDTDPDRCWAPAPSQSTRLGWLLRASHLDELPQLINVLRGEMSLVGPRPERPQFAARFAAEIPGYAGRTRMKAGLTGLAQVRGLTGDTPLAGRAAADNCYIDNWSLRLDLVILARTGWLTLAALAAGLRRAAASRAPAPCALLPVPSSLTGQGGQP